MEKLRRQSSLPALYLAVAVVALNAPAAKAQLVDLQQSPNTADVGIAKSLGQETGAGVGDVMTPNSSIYIIKRDPARAIRRGRQIFQRKFTKWQGLGPRVGDGTGNIETDPRIGAGLSDSCGGCHGRPRGSAGSGGNVATRPDSRDAPHLFGLGVKEMLGDEITTDLRAIRTQALAQARSTNTAVSLALTSKGINYGTIRALPNGTVDTSQVVGVNPDLRVRPFGAQGATISIREFLVGAFKAEMGIEAVDPQLAQASSGGVFTTPSGMVLNGQLDKIDAPPDAFPGQDNDGDGVTNELPAALVDFEEFYLLNYFKPATYEQTSVTQQGLATFNQIGCNSCHIQDLTINHDRRVADFETAYDAQRGIFNELFATATLKFNQTNDGSGFPTLKLPAQQSFVVHNFFADMKRHDLGPNFHERNYDGTTQTLFMTPPLWGVGSTAPYGHDGRSVNLREVILRHGGEAQAQRDAFAALPDTSKSALIEFLNSLVLFPPDDTASSLDPGNPAAVGFPQQGHGSIKLGVLFNNPSDPE